MPPFTHLWPALKWVACLPGNHMLHLVTDTWPSIGSALGITNHAPFSENAWWFSMIFWLAVLFFATELVATPRRRKARKSAIERMPRA
ncbi:MAG: hypothetical protein EPN41_02475 [Candidimonas sp.]|nr:MAG: hypothetical protein EPN41_02475 [Candidimonas sp.]